MRHICRIIALAGASIALQSPVARAVSFAENFDAVTPPALPGGWTASATQSGVVWQTNGLVADTPPNGVGIGVPAAVADQSLTSPSVAISSANATLTFRHKFAFDVDNNGARDGGRLEISIDGIRQGDFQDIIDAGGEFVTGGYTHGISSPTNPLYGGGRQVWAGFLNDSFMTTTVKLPTSASGSNIRLRWRMVSDDSVSTVGWKLDSIILCDAGDTTSTVCQNNNCGSGACGAGGMPAVATVLLGIAGARRRQRKSGR